MNIFLTVGTCIPVRFKPNQWGTRMQIIAFDPIRGKLLCKIASDDNKDSKKYIVEYSENTYIVIGEFDNKDQIFPTEQFINKKL